MNKGMMKKNLNTVVKLQPAAKRVPANRAPEHVDDEWVVTSVADDKIEIKNLRTDHSPSLGLDHIHQYVTDPMRERGGRKAGILVLNVQLSFNEWNCWVVPTAPPGTPR